MQFNLNQVLLRLSDKIHQKMGQQLCIREIKRPSWRKEWLNLMKYSNIVVNMLVQMKAMKLFTNKGFYQCDKPASLLYSREHNR